MIIPLEEQKKLARKGLLFDDQGNRIKPSDLDAEETIPPPKREIDKQLQVLQNTMDAMMAMAKQSDASRQFVIEALSQMSNKVNPAPIVNVKPIMPSDDWKEFESEVVEHFPGGRIKKIVHRRIN
jgi:hypothetical protein